MNKKLVYVMGLIMLECRLSLDTASKLFRVDKNTLEVNLKEVFKGNYFLAKSIDYLMYYESFAHLNEDKGKFKAVLLINRFYKIEQIKDANLRRELLNRYMADLEGPNLKDIDFQKGIYTEEERYKILKYRLKYRLSGEDIRKTLGVKHAALASWEANLTDQDLKIRLEILREHLTENYRKKMRRERRLQNN